MRRMLSAALSLPVLEEGQKFMSNYSTGFRAVHTLGLYSNNISPNNATAK